MSQVSLLWHQFKYEGKIATRNPAGLFFTVLLPLGLLLILTSVGGKDSVVHSHGGIKSSIYTVPALITFSVTSATMMGLAISLTRARENGVLKRMRGAPVPAWTVIAGRVGISLATAFGMAVVLSLVAWALHGVHPPTRTLPAALVTLALGAMALSSLGISLTSLIPSEESAPAIANAFVLPLLFLSGVFIPDDEIPNSLLHVANVLPVRPLFEALLVTFNPGTTGAGFSPHFLWILAAWALGGQAIARRTFRWTPRQV